MAPMPAFEDQVSRELLVGRFLSITLGQWREWIIATGDAAIPDELHPHLVSVIEGLAGSPETYQSYLQALALLSDAALAWLVTSVAGD
jgi:hypothetical protein